MIKKKVSVIITDLDNTLYDWFEVWHQSFRAMLNRLVQDSGIEEERLISEIKKVHEKHGTSEYLLLIQELQSLKDKHPDEDPSKVYSAAIEAYSNARSTYLRLYPSVLETLRTLKGLGCLIVGYTESQAFYTEFRVKELGLDGIIDYLYSPQNHEMPQNLTPEQAAFYPVTYRKLEYTQHRHTPKGEIKPNPHILRSIITEINAPLEEVAYVGDSLTKDIIMAQGVPVIDVFAQYGTSHKREEYELLRKVTHWKLEHVENEKITDQTTVVPTFVLKVSYSEILTLFNFIPYVGLGAKVPEAQISHYIEVWKKTVDVQQHFNDLELRIRNLAITVLGAILSGAAFSLKENIKVVLYGFSIPVAVLLIIAGLITWIAFYLMDRHWYHRLLIGSVKHGEAIEKRLATTLPQIALTQSISEASPIVIGNKKIRSSTKMNGFYAIVAGILIIFGLALICGNPSKPKEPSSTSTSVADTKETNRQESSPSPATESPEQENKNTSQNSNVHK